MIYQRNTDGAVLNPPVIPSYEIDLGAAAARCDFGTIVRLTADYNAARDAIVKHDEGTEKGLGWSARDMRGGVDENANALAIRPKFPTDGGQYMPVHSDDASLAEQQMLRAEVSELRAAIAALAASGALTGVQMDKPAPVVDAAQPLGSTDITAGPADKPTPPVAAAQPLGATGVTAGPADPVTHGGGLVPGAGVVHPPATGAPDATDSQGGEVK